MIAFILIVVGGLNWLLHALNYNVVDLVLPDTAAKVVYVLVGLSAIYEVATHGKNCRMCKGGSSMSSL